MAIEAATPIQPVTRAVTRPIEAGSAVDCAHCDQLVKFRARQRDHQIICNVYVDGRWHHVEHYHADCYEIAGSPHGTPSE
jgi:hypothetical protein